MEKGCTRDYSRAQPFLWIERVLLNVYGMVRLYLLSILRKDDGQDTIIEGSVDIIFLDARHRELTAEGRTAAFAADVVLLVILGIVFCLLRRRQGEYVVVVAQVNVFLIHTRQVGCHDIFAAPVFNIDFRHRELLLRPHKVIEEIIKNIRNTEFVVINNRE